MADIYLCHTCSCHEILRMETPGQALAHQDGGVALYELEPSRGSWRELWCSADCACAEACWPRFSFAPRTGMLGACVHAWLAGPYSVHLDI
eukprot:COSAG01_NODE_1412_length_10404_cov_48.915478_3_plen_91_part_00